ncbi:MAG: zinc-ribbon domain-containing protein [Ardenticatenales bacterium]|nr:zinc-ribbon domain-containing protein [Ardenticatenales bacterium]
MENVLPCLIGIAGVAAFILMMLVLSGIKLLYQYERGVMFTLGKYTGTRGPGLTIVVPIFQSMRRVDMRVKTADIPRQEVITKDNIPLLTNAVVYFRVINPADAIIKIEDYVFAVRQYTQAALRDVIGNAELDFVLTEREMIAKGIKEIVDSETAGWGVDLEAIKIQEIELPAEMKRAMAKQAEAERERRAVIIASKGELSASQNLMKAADYLSRYPGALHLRTLQTIRDIAADPSEKIVVVLPSTMESLPNAVARAASAALEKEPAREQTDGTTPALVTPPPAEPAVEQEPGRRCPQCNAEIRPNATYCAKCGGALVD